MGDRILLFESRDLCYESNRYFMECLKEAFENLGHPAKICDLSIRMEEKLERALESREDYWFAMDFNSLLPRLRLEDGTPYLEALKLPFFNYLVDHPLYHHAGLQYQLSGYFVLCIDERHRDYIRKYYPHIKKAAYLPLGAMRAGMERGFDQKRLELLFLGTYEPEDALYQELAEYEEGQRKEISTLIEWMRDDDSLAPEDALVRYLDGQSIQLTEEEFVQRLNRDYLADKYLRNLKRKEAVAAAAKAGIPFTVAGHGWETVKELTGAHVTLKKGVGFAASLQLMANAKMLLNTTPGFHGGFHDRVYSAMINRTLCFTEDSPFAREMYRNGWETVLYGSGEQLAERLVLLHENRNEIEEIAGRAYEQVLRFDTWEKRAERILRLLEEDRKEIYDGNNL